MRIGVQKRFGVPHDRDMALPEDQVAALQSSGIHRIQRTDKPVALHVAVARAAGARGVQRYLHEAGAIDTKTALAAPQIGRADQSFGHRDKIRRHPSIGKMLRGRYQPCRVTRTGPLAAPQRRPITSVSTGDNLIDGPGKANVLIA